MDLEGIGSKLAGWMIGEILSISNFRIKRAFAAYNGTCCLEHKSGKTTRNTLCNRHLQAALRDWAGCRIRVIGNREIFMQEACKGKITIIL
ncbi:hypothetical protein BXT86_03035 [candidate division WOR-3 bacterium 4484_100]|uniref:Transposase IS116/IS110/IS902 C-terminal domain-containing protein n=1 Tax=candidate division WOR-3 bacterium 4484_100 TaxID=1936077 RepID=A0A1V4QGF6_UNCW3|nr:MAG: hypothetical protein BXT86_03035 [candidate division WOR-3 bacterium 4484_100]